MFPPTATTFAGPGVLTGAIEMFRQTFHHTQTLDRHLVAAQEGITLDVLEGANRKLRRSPLPAASPLWTFGIHPDQ